MPPFETMDRRQKAVLLAKSGTNRYGEVTFSAPTEIKVRWVTGKREALDAQGNTIGVDVTAVVDQVISVGSHLWKGSLQDWNDTGSASATDEEMEVVAYNETPDIKNKNIRRTIGLIYARTPG